MNDEEAVQLLLDLLAIPSVTGSESEAVRFFTDTMDRAGFETAVDGAGNGVATKAGAGPQLVFLGHIDTVHGEIASRIEGGNAFGRGAVDAKGPLACAMVAAVRCQSPCRIEVIAAVGEEGASPGARYLAKLRGPDALIIGEPSGSDSVVLGYKGSMRAKIEFTFPQAHSAGQEQTVADRAIDSWVRIREACVELSPGPTAFDSLSPALLSVVTESDGLTATATLEAGFRLPLNLEIDQVRSVVEAAALPGRVLFQPSDPAFASPRSSRLVASFVRSIRDEGLNPRFKHKTGTSDMNIVGPAWGCPAVAFGPGDSSLDHTPNEHVSISEYLRGIRVLTRVFDDWAAKC